eukprot:COSAG04_NODE_8330_length_989_cov_1.097753_2_plen_254_part_01
MAVLRDSSLRAQIPFWVIFHVSAATVGFGCDCCVTLTDCCEQTIPFQGHSDPTEAELRWMAMTALGFGAKGVLYFTYWQAAGGGPLGLGGSIIKMVRRADNRSAPMRHVRGPHYSHVRRINSVLRVFGERLLAANSTAVYLPAAANSTQEAILPEGAPIRSINGTGVGTAWEALVSEFAMADGSSAFLLQNQRHDRSLWASVTFRPALEAVMEVSAIDGTVAPLMDDSPEHAGVQIALEAGAARLFVLRAPARR